MAKKTGNIEIKAGYIYDQKFNYQSITPTDSVRTGLRIDTGISKVEYNGPNYLATAVTFNTAFGSVPIIVLQKTDVDSGLSVQERREGTTKLASPLAGTFGIHYFVNTGTFTAGDWIEINWIAVGEWA